MASSRPSPSPTAGMANSDAIVSLEDTEVSAQILEMVSDFSLDPQSPKLANAVFGTVRKRSLSKLKEPSRRDSPTLPWKNPLRFSRRESGDGKSSLVVPEPLQPMRPDSPDIETILAKTPRPRRKAATSMFPSPRSPGATSPRLGQRPLPDSSLSSLSVYGSLFEDDSDPEGGGSESDSSIDIHTPLPLVNFSIQPVRD